MLVLVAAMQGITILISLCLTETCEVPQGHSSTLLGPLICSGLVVLSGQNVHGSITSLTKTPQMNTEGSYSYLTALVAIIHQLPSSANAIESSEIDHHII